MGVLFATCYEAAELKELQALTGKMVACETTPGGVIKWREADAEEVASHAAGEVGVVPLWCCGACLPLSGAVMVCGG
jgi:hypothetical protein